MDHMDQLTMVVVVREDLKPLRTNLSVNSAESGHFVQRCYHKFEISFTGINTPQQSLATCQPIITLLVMPLGMTATNPEFVDNNCWFHDLEPQIM